MHTAIRKQVGVNIAALREERGLSQSDLALRADIDRSHISRMENASANWTLDSLISIAYGLDVPITRLFDGLDCDSPQNLNPFDYVIAGIAKREDAHS